MSKNSEREKAEAQAKKAEAEAQARYQEIIEKLREGHHALTTQLREQSGIVFDEIIDPEGEAISCLAEVEGDSGALALATPLDMITTETWLLGQIGDADELDLDNKSHREFWFNLGACLGETLRLRHGGHWLFMGDDPRAWRLGFSKIFLEIVPHLFAEQLLRMGPGAVKKMLAEIERLRLNHEAQKEKDQGKELDRFSPQHYIRMHTMPLGQWMVMDFASLGKLWNEGPTKDLIVAIKEAGQKLGEQNAPVVEQIVQALQKANQEKPIAQQTKDKGLFEAIAQIVGMRRTSQPIAMDILESLVIPALHIGVPESFPPLDEEDIGKMHKGIELFALFVDIVPHKHQAWDDGFLNAIPTDDLATPYRDKTNLEIGKGDWVIVNPKRFVEMLDGYEPDKLLVKYDEFVKHLRENPDAPNRRDNGRQLAETVTHSLKDFGECVRQATEQKQALLFRLLPPPQ